MRKFAVGIENATHFSSSLYAVPADLVGIQVQVEAAVVGIDSGIRTLFFRSGGPQNGENLPLKLVPTMVSSKVP